MQQIWAKFTPIIIIVLIIFLLPATVLVAGENEQVNVIIGLEKFADVSVLNSLVDEVLKEYTIIDGVKARMPRDMISTLSTAEGVRYIEEVKPVYALIPKLPSVNQSVPWGIERVFGEEEYPFSTWDVSSGEGVKVAVLDTGIDENHEDLPPLEGGVNTIDDTHWGQDDNGHGTLVTGVIAALDNDTGVVGVAPEADIYSVKVLDESGTGNTSSVIEGIEWAVNEDIPVLNMSIGFDGDSSEFSPLAEACQNAYEQGYLLIGAAGNDGENSNGENVNYPGAYDSVLAISASDEFDDIADFSSTGPEVELIAPGAEIDSTYPGDGYETANGTSLSVPHVTGAAVLIWAAEPGLNNVQVRNILQDTAEDIGLPENEQGYGLCRADKGVDKTVEEDLLDDPFTLEINVYDLAGDEFVSPGHVVITFRDTDAGTEEIIDLDEVDFTGTDGVKVWQVGTGDNSDIELQELETADINEITVEVDAATDTITGLNE